MGKTLKNNTDRRSRAVVSVAEAAAIFGKSTSWVRNRVTDNSLELAARADAERIAITIASVVRLSEEIAGARDRKAERPWLRLVVNNDPE